MKMKSVFDRVLWLVYSTAAILLFCYIAMAASARLGDSAPVGLAAVAVLLLVWAVINTLVQFILRRKHTHGGDHTFKAALTEGIALAVILAGTLVWRLLTFGSAALGEYYETARVAYVGVYDPEVASGAAELYLRLLHGLLWLFGNVPAVTYALQLVLYFALMVVYYFAVRSLCGVGTGLLAAAMAGASPLLGERFLADRPEILAALVFFAGFLMVVTYWSRWNRCQEQRGLPGAICRCVVTGALIGLGVYMDAAAILLVLVLACVMAGGRKPAGEGVTDSVYGFWNRRTVAFLMIMVFGLAAFCGMLYTCGLSTADWLGQYTTFTAAPSALLTVSDSGLWEITIVSGLMTLGVFTSQNRFCTADSGMQRLCLLLCSLLLAAAQYSGILTETSTDSRFLLYLFLLAFAGVSIADLFVPGSRPEAAVQSEKEAQPAEKLPEKNPESEQPAAPEPALQPAVPTESGQPAKPEPAQVTFLESPLPLPKKHARKTLDYDIEVAEDDDYDFS